MDIQLLAAELQRHVVQNRKLHKADFAKATTVFVDQYCRKVTKVKGVYQVLHTIMSHVVQGFEPVWQELGVFSVRDKELKNYHQKVNLPIVPAEVLSTALADLYEEDVEITNKQICKIIIDHLRAQVQDDLELLSAIGVYNQALAPGAFGYSLNGWNKIISDALANVVNPVYKVPLNAITDENVYDELLSYERKLPKILKKKIKAIHLSENNLERYEIAYKNKHGQDPSYDENDRTKSPLRKRVLVGHTDWEDDKIIATIEGNMLNLIDVIDNPPKITMIQVHDYKVKIFMEFWKGWDFLINQCVCVADFAGTTLGLGNPEQMAMYYPHEVLEDEESD